MLRALGKQLCCFNLSNSGRNLRTSDSKGKGKAKNVDGDAGTEPLLSTNDRAEDDLKGMKTKKIKKTMASASWKIVPDPSEEHKTEYTPLLTARKFYAVDDSGSTAGTIARKQKEFVDAVRQDYAHPDDSISLWGSSCDAPTRHFTTTAYNSRHGGTSPSTILTQSYALEAIRAADAWFLLTDGEVWDGEVHRLAQMAQEYGVLNVPMVFVITGKLSEKPSETNISVGISFFASSTDCLILYKDKVTGKLYVIASKGCFAEVGHGAVADDLENWGDMRVFKGEADFFAFCQTAEIRVASASTRVQQGRGVSLGQEWQREQGEEVMVDLDGLLTAGLLGDEDACSLLAEEAFNTLAVAYKTRHRIGDLRKFVQQQKVEQTSPKLEDVAGAAAIIAKMNDSTTTAEQRKELQEKLRAAHAKNREHYNSASSNFESSPEVQRTKKRNLLVDAALRSLAEIEGAGFSADILSRKSNRARRAEVVTSVPAIEVTKLDLETPSCKGFCLVCCGEDEIMSICFREPQEGHEEDNTTDFALNFPLAAGASVNNVELVSSQNICFQCAVSMPEGRSIYNEDMTAVIPTVQYDGSNKKYINDQLYLALTARLATGAAGIGQLFLAMLQEILRTKSWAGAGLDGAQASADEVDEVQQRQKTFNWMFDQVLQNTRTREDFKETGEWVKLPKALEWVAADFESNGLASFAVTYPVSGFNNLLILGQHTGAVTTDLLQRLKAAKTIHSVAAKYLSDVLAASTNGSAGSQAYKQKYLEALYQDFNGAQTPKDQGVNSLVTDVETFKSRMAACVGGSQMQNADENVMRKVQLILFWLLFNHHGHCTAQTFFGRIRDSQPLASAVLDDKQTVPASEHQELLLSIFAFQGGELIDAIEGAKHNAVIAFANPFGASVLQCGCPDCNVSFSSFTAPDEINDKTVHAIRNARRQHLIQVFGFRGRFEGSDTGLPERLGIGRPPSSAHVNMHIAMVDEWVDHSEAQRQAIIDNAAARDAFVAKVVERLCQVGRGNIFIGNLSTEIDRALPSFFRVLETALAMQGREGARVAEYVHDENDRSLVSKAQWELKARAFARA